MNRTKIEWTNFSWNPIVGCDRGCFYCYAKRLTQRFPKNFPNGFEPTFYPERLGEPAKRKKPAKIFVCSIADLFAPWTKDEWREAVLKDIEQCPIEHTFQLLTKNPERIDKDYKFPDNVWVGTTVTGEGDLENIEEIKKIKAKVKFVSFEPLLTYIFPNLANIDWVIVGKLTGSKKVMLNPEWVKTLIDKTRLSGIPLFLKDNLNWPEKIQEFPILTKNRKGVEDEDN